VGTGAPVSAAGSNLEVRQNVDSLTTQQMTDFVNAILVLKQTTLPGHQLNEYDEFVQMHINAFNLGEAHGNPDFLPWHREFLLQFEHLLQTVNPTVTIPYWDFTVDNSPTSPIFSSIFMGGNGDPNDNYVVHDGPFQAGPQWKIYGDPSSTDLRREFGVFVPSLPTPEDVAAGFGIGQYDTFPYDVGSPLDQSFRNYVEGWNSPTGGPALHNDVHAWLGGSDVIVSSPNDPIFWLLHANIDRLWAEWEDQYGLLYAPDSGDTQGHGLNDPMYPFGDVTPADVLDAHALGYVYDTELQGPASPVPGPPGLVLLGAGVAVLLGRRRAGSR
jgi:tyrosinase